MKVLPILLGALTVLAVLLVGAAPTSAQAINGGVTGPPALAPGQVAAYNLTIVGEPEGAEVNYTVIYWITGSNLTGGAPLTASPGRATGNRTAYALNVTAPGQDQAITLVVSIEARSVTGVESATVEQPITVVTPIVLTATFHNASPTAATNVTVRFYVDGVLAGTSTIRQVAANADATVTVNYLPTELATGPHTVRAEADLDHNGVIDASKGEVVVSDLFFRETPGLSPGWTFLIGMAAFIPVFLGVVALRRRRQA